MRWEPKGRRKGSDPVLAFDSRGVGCWLLNVVIQGCVRTFGGGVSCLQLAYIFVHLRDDARPRSDWCVL